LKIQKVLKIVGWIVITIFFFTQTAFAGRKIYSYHNAPDGTPLIITDEKANIVWRADYKPFGEEQSTSGTIENTKQFIGKEMDVETGLIYINHRYYDPKRGQFLTPDPIGPVNPWNSKTNYEMLHNPQRLNPYAYGLNNPYKYIDVDGQWPSKIILIHQASINRVLSGLPARDRVILNERQVAMDNDQSSAGAFMHAMRAPRQSDVQAWEAANTFVRNELAIARQLEKSGRHDEALIHVGNAMHTIQDSTSPPHMGYQEWDENSSIWSKGVHTEKEAFDPGSGSDLDASTRRAWDIFKSNAPIPKEVLSLP